MPAPVQLALKRMARRKGLTLGAAVGLCLAVALVAAIPTYTDGVLRRTLVKDLERLQEESGLYPGGFRVEVDLLEYYTEGERRELYRMLEELSDPDGIERRTGLAVLGHVNNLVRDYLAVLSDVDPGREEPRVLRLEALSGFEAHAAVTHGRMWREDRGEGPLELLATEHALRETGLLLGTVYRFPGLADAAGEPIRFTIVGTFAPARERDPYWFRELRSFEVSLVMDYEAFRRRFVDGRSSIVLSSRWYSAMDYHGMTVDGAQAVLGLHCALERRLRSYPFTRLDVPAIAVLERYGERRRKLVTELWVVETPVLLMLALYLVVVSRLIVEGDRNDIAVLKSRGAATAQVVGTYATEAALLCLASMAVGPPAALALCRLLGASDGFLELVRRSGMAFALGPRAYRSAAVAAGAYLAAAIVVSRGAACATVVVHKRSAGRPGARPPVLAFAMEVSLLLVSAYGYSRYRSRLAVLDVTGAGGTDVAVDPLVVAAVSFFVVGCSLLLVRLYPRLVSLLHGLGRRRWPAALHVSLLQASRGGPESRQVVLFLTLALATGLYSAASARSLNTGIRDRTRYAVGADVVLRQYWESNRLPLSPSIEPSGARPLDISVASAEPLIYVEPPFDAYVHLGSVQDAARVFRRPGAQARAAGSPGTETVTLMGIVPHEFGKVAWFRSGLLPGHANAYLNLLTQDPQAAIVSRSLYEAEGLRLGDTLSVSWPGQGFTAFTVAAVVDYWPGWNPVPGPGTRARPALVVGNLRYVQAKMALEPYEVWIRRKPGSTAEELYRALERSGMEIESLEDADQAMLRARNDPAMQGMNGSLTLGFLATLAVLILAYLTHWIRAARSRALELALLRALGMPRRGVLGTIALELAVSTAYAVLCGIWVGAVASAVGVPLSQVAANATELVPPFRVVVERGDIVRLGLFVGLTVVAGFSSLGVYVSRIEVPSTLKLGER